MSDWDAFPTAPAGQDEWGSFPQAQAPAPEAPPAAVRAAGQFGRGFNDSAAETVGAIPDALGWAMRQLGIPNAPRPGFYADAAKTGIRSLTDMLGTPPAPQGTMERAAYGAGRGTADAASVALPAAGLARGAQAGGMMAGIGNALSAQPGLQAVSGAVGGAVGEATDSPLAGLAASLAVPAAGAIGARAITPVRPNLNPEQMRLAQVARQEGIPLSAGQETGSKPLRTLESVFAQLPMTARPQEAINDAQRVAFNQAALRRAGVNADRASPDVMQAARTQIGREIGDIANRNTLNYTPQLAQRLQQIDDSLQYVTPEIGTPIRNRINQIRGMVQPIPNNGAPVPPTAMIGTVPGASYRILDSELGRNIRNTGNGDLRAALGDLRGTLRTAMDSSISPADAQDWQQARLQYANLMNISGALQPGAAGATVGNISPAALSHAVNRGTGGNYAFGQGDMNDLARVGREFVRDPVPDSGTMQRTMMANLLTGGTLGGGVGMLSGGSPLMGAAAAAGGLLAPRAIQGAYNTDAIRRYLTNGLVQGPSVNGGLVSALLASRGKDQALSP